MKRRDILIGASATLLLGAAGVIGWRASTGSMAEYDAYARRLRAPLPDHPAIADLIRVATLAANSHNTQPWRFRVADGEIGILPDPTRATPVVDPDDHHLFVSLGCAIETLRIAATATGRPGEIATGGAEEGATYRFTEGAAQPDPLSSAILTRQSTRADYDGRALSAADASQLAAAAAVPGVHLILLTERAAIGQIRDLVVAGNTAQMADAAYLRELKQWLRFNPQSAMATSDGLFAAASGNPVLPTALGALAFDRLVTAASENERYARQVQSSSGVAVFVGDRADKEHWIAVGRACQRFALTASALGLKHAFINQPVEVPALRSELAGLVGEAGKRPDIVMRFGYGPSLPYSLRRPVEAVTAT